MIKDSKKGIYEKNWQKNNSIVKKEKLKKNLISIRN